MVSRRAKTAVMPIAGGVDAPFYAQRPNLNALGVYLPRFLSILGREARRPGTGSSGTWPAARAQSCQSSASRYRSPVLWGVRSMPCKWCDDHRPV